MALKTSQMHVKDWKALRDNWPKKKEEKPEEVNIAGATRLHYVAGREDSFVPYITNYNKEKTNGKEK